MNNLNNKSCSIFGHRKIKNIKIENLEKIFLYLILEKNITTFMFGTKSDFYNICYEVLSNLQKKYNHIQLVLYVCKSETGLLKEDMVKWEIIRKNQFNNEVRFSYYDKIVDLIQYYNAGKASYIERNQYMVDNSDICLFYFDEKYQVETENFSIPKSGTRLIYEYAKRKNKEIILYSDFIS